VGALRVEVDDSGAGINEVDQTRLFNEFCQFDRNKLQGGGLRNFIYSILILFTLLGFSIRGFRIGSVDLEDNYHDA